jgi:hypothetical protein
MARAFAGTLFVIVFLGAACVTPVAEPNTSTSAGSNGTSGANGTSAGATGGSSGTGGNTTTGGTNDAGPCPNGCPMAHWTCDPSAGQCVCVPNYSICGTSCVDLGADDANCGSCGTTCDRSTGYFCANGACTCGVGNFGLCPLPDGGTVCTDPNADPRNCGGCGNDCSSLQCINGFCACASPLAECDRPGLRYCADLSRDIDNCGTCSKLCGDSSVPKHTREVYWQCVSPNGGPGFCACNSGFTPCQAKTTSPVECVDISTDAQNCGACSVVCDAGTCKNQVCS